MSLFFYSSSFAGDIKIFDEEAYSRVTPVYFLDHTGFDLPPDFKLSIKGLDSSTPIFPMFPTYREAMFGLNREHVGIVIPEKYLGLKPKPKDDERMVFSTLTKYLPEKVQEAARQVRQAGLSPFFLNNRIYGIKPGLGRIEVSRKTTWGISLDLDFSEYSDFVLREESGFTANLAEPFKKIMEHTHFLLNGEKAEETIETVLQYLPYLQYHLAQNARAAEYEILSDGRLIPAIYAKLLEIGEYERPSLNKKIHLDDYTEEFWEIMSSFKKNLEEERDWIRKVKPAVDSALIVGEKDWNILVQQACDYLSDAYGIPPSFWPRCRVSATLHPNAFAYPGGDIFVTAGLIGTLSDLDSLLFVLGHEIGHVVGRHTSRRMPLINTASTVTNVFGIAGQLFVLSGAAGVPVGSGAVETINIVSWLPRSMGSNFVMGLGMDLFVKSVVAGLMAHSRQAEREADQLGHQAALGCGAKQDSLLDGWSEFIDYVKKYYGIPEGWLDKIFASHPTGKERHKALDERFSDYKRLVDHYRDPKDPREHINRLSDKFYISYSQLHKELQPLMKNFGEYLLQEVREGEEKRQPFARETLFSSGGWCLHYALGGLK